MKITITAPRNDQEFGGTSSKVNALSQALIRRGHDVQLLSSYGKSSLSWHGTPVQFLSTSQLALLRKSDVVHVTGFRDPVGTQAALYRQLHRGPLVIEPTGMLAIRGRSRAIKRTFDLTLGRLVFRDDVPVIATSELEAAEIRERLGSNRIYLRPVGIPWFADPSAPEPTFRRRYGIPEGALLVTSLTRIVDGKGLKQLISAVMRMNDVYLCIAGPVGDNSIYAELERLIGASGEDVRILLLPQGLWGEEKLSALFESDCFCLFSDYESFGTVVAEAAAAGVPTVVTERCGIVPLLDPDITRVVPCGDITALVRALDEVLNNESLKSLARQRAGKMRSLLSWTRLSELQEHIYMDIVSSWSRP